MADRSSIDLDELVEHWTVLDDERALVDAKHGATKLGFALLLKFYKENILFRVAEASLAAPDGTVRGVEFPAVTGGEQTLRELVHEFKTSGPLYRRTVQTTLKASYALSGHDVVQRRMALGSHIVLPS